MPPPFFLNLFHARSGTVVPEQLANDQYLMESAYKNSLDKVRDAIQKGANVNVRDASGHSPLSVTRSFDIVKLLVENGADPNVGMDTIGGEHTPLVTAMYNRDLRSVKYLVEKGAKISSVAKEIVDTFETSREISNYIKNVSGTPVDWRGGRRRKTYRKKGKKSKKTRRH